MAPRIKFQQYIFSNMVQTIIIIALILFSSDFGFETLVNLYPISRFSSTLKISHVTYAISRNQMEIPYIVPIFSISKIPSLEIYYHHPAILLSLYFTYFFIISHSLYLRSFPLCLLFPFFLLFFPFFLFLFILFPYFYSFYLVYVI